MATANSRRFYLGCAVWSYKDWVGEFYPSGSKPRDWLALYSQRLTAVEGNTTFYAVPDAKTIARWASETTPGFKFCPKFPQTVTHSGGLKAALPEALAFVERVEALGDRLGAIFAQLPPSYAPAFYDDLAGFGRALPRDRVRFAVEVRHSDWFSNPHASWLNELLQELGMGRVLLDTRPIYRAPDDPQIHSERRKPPVPLHYDITADFSIVRFISHPQAQFNREFWQEWVEQCASWLGQEKTIYFFVHCPQEVRSPENARTFQALLEADGVPVPPLPWNQLASSQQLSLWG